MTNNWGRLISTFSLLISFSVSSVATDLDGKNYIGVGVSQLNYDESPISTNHSALTLKFGHEINEFLAVEGRASLSPDEVKVEDDEVGEFNFEIDYLVGMYFRGNLVIGGNPRVRAYGMLGFTRGKFSASTSGGSNSDSETDLGYGIGIELYGNEDNAISLEFMRALDVDDEYEFTVDSITVGYIHRF
jgi:opacity protein-like surface antigen